MYGLIGKLRAQAGKRDALVAVLTQGLPALPGCRSYVVAEDPQDADALWITEVWETSEAHRASLAIPEVQAAIEQGKPLIAAFEQHVETVPVGGHGLGD